MGGRERHLLTLIDHLRAGHHITFFSDRAEAGNLFHSELNARGIGLEIIPGRVKETRGLLVPSLKNLPLIARARSAFAAARLDVIHFHNGRLGVIYGSIVASWLAGIPTRILTAHSPVLERSPAQKFIEGRVLGRLHHIIAISDEIKQDLVRKKAAAAAKITVIPNGVEPAEFNPSDAERIPARTALGLPDEGPVIGMVGRLDRLKGADVLIRAVPLIKTKMPTLRVVLIGTGDDEKELKGLAAQQGISDIVLFTGYRSDARRLMHALDLLVLPSRYEGQSLSLLEAMACGKPVVGANVGGIPGVLVDGVTGLLFPSEDVATLAEAIVKLLSDPQKREIMGLAGRRRIETCFSQATMLERIVSLYNMPACVGRSTTPSGRH
jgi:glycosyltransferase involved in cell wall biosynthesis